MCSPSFSACYESYMSTQNIILDKSRGCCYLEDRGSSQVGPGHFLPGLSDPCWEAMGRATGLRFWDFKFLFILFLLLLFHFYSNLSNSFFSLGSSAYTHFKVMTSFETATFKDLPKCLR